jgi:hypothetical protein
VNRRQWLWVAGIAVGLLGWRVIDQIGRPAPAPATVIREIRKLNQLVTVRYTVQRVVDLTEPKQPLGEERILLILQARVEAGVDLGSIAEGDVVRRPDGVLVIRMPAARILNVAVDEKETRVWDRRITWWTPWVPPSLDLERKAREVGLAEARRAAEEAGIVAQARQDAEASIATLLRLAGVKEVLFAPPGSS